MTRVHVYRIRKPLGILGAPLMRNLGYPKSIIGCIEGAQGRRVTRKNYVENAGVPLFGYCFNTNKYEYTLIPLPPFFFEIA